ncbi:MAG: hypothetical protein ACRD50_10195 [Candidatus Acidiferrales bacterium]
MPLTPEQLDQLQNLATANKPLTDDQNNLLQQLSAIAAADKAAAEAQATQTPDDTED